MGGQLTGSLGRFCFHFFQPSRFLIAGFLHFIARQAHYQCRLVVLRYTSKRVDILCICAYSDMFIVCCTKKFISNRFIQR